MVSYAIDGFEFGQRKNEVLAARRGIIVESTVIDPGSLTTQDATVVGQDGRLFGEDYLPGATVTFTGTVVAIDDPQGALNLYSQLDAAWNNPDIRMVPGRMSELRLLYPGTDVPMMAYGRGRQITPTLGAVRQGTVPYVAAFDMTNNTFYGFDEQSLEMSLLPDLSGGLIPPITLPIVLAPNQKIDTTVHNSSAETFPLIDLIGPVANPAIEYPYRSIKATLQVTIPAGIVVTLDTRPWAASITDQNGGSYAGRLKGARLADLRLPTGDTLVRFTGQDLTGNARCLFRWRSAAPIMGGL